MQLEKLCGTICADCNSEIYDDLYLCYGYFSMQEDQHTLRTISITPGNRNLLDGSRKRVRRDGRWLEDNIIPKFSGKYIWCDESVTIKYRGTYSILGRFHPWERTAKRHPACCGHQEGCPRRDQIAQVLEKELFLRLIDP